MERGHVLDGSQSLGRYPPLPFSLPLSLETSSEEVVYKPPGYITALICAPLVERTRLYFDVEGWM
jgi:hypothetical protein